MLCLHNRWMPCASMAIGSCESGDWLRWVRRMSQVVLCQSCIWMRHVILCQDSSHSIKVILCHLWLGQSCIWMRHVMRAIDNVTRMNDSRSQVACSLAAATTHCNTLQHITTHCDTAIKYCLTAIQPHTLHAPMTDQTEKRPLLLKKASNCEKNPAFRC